MLTVSPVSGLAGVTVLVICRVVVVEVAVGIEASCSGLLSALPSGEAEVTVTAFRIESREMIPSVAKIEGRRRGAKVLALANLDAFARCKVIGLLCSILN
jgi:hypothetical protein